MVLGNVYPAYATTGSVMHIYNKATLGGGGGTCTVVKLMFYFSP